MAIRTIHLSSTSSTVIPPPPPLSTSRKRKRFDPDDDAFSETGRDEMMSGLSMADRIMLREVAMSVVKSRKILVVTGAGISCSAGIPDFRSQDGLYNLLKSSHPKSLLTGKDLFSANVFRDPTTYPIFNTFIGHFSSACTAATPTATHQFIRRLEGKKKLLRCYTQNVDGLEARLGMEARSKGMDKKMTKVVELHGSVGRVRCGLCNEGWKMSEEWRKVFKTGEAPACPACTERAEARIRRQSRQISIGHLRPDMVLYDEPHPSGEEMSLLQDHDLRQGPDCLVIMGTSLKIPGLKGMLKDFANGVHAGQDKFPRGKENVNRKTSTTTQSRKRLVIYVNLDPPTSEWTNFIDVHVRAETDVWVRQVEEEWRGSVPADWEVQTRLEVEDEVEVPRRERKGLGKSGSRGAKVLAMDRLRDISNTLSHPTILSPPAVPMVAPAHSRLPNSFLVAPLSPSPSPTKLSPTKRRFADENLDLTPSSTRLGDKFSTVTAIVPPLTPAATPQRAKQTSGHVGKGKSSSGTPNVKPCHRLALDESDLSESEEEDDTMASPIKRRRAVSKTHFGGEAFQELGGKGILARRGRETAGKSMGPKLDTIRIPGMTPARA